MDLKTQCLWKSKYWVMDGTTFELWTVWNSLHPCCYPCRLLEHLCRMLCNFQKNQIFTVTQHNQGFALAEWHLIFRWQYFSPKCKKAFICLSHLQDGSNHVHFCRVGEIGLFWNLFKCYQNKCKRVLLILAKMDLFWGKTAQDIRLTLI